ncbi:hypothetical protein IFR05_006932 [Cadophora sp. M221]|nr:hypothetical protein IFR05_006932 [Cadophora sp. M221]
MNQVRVRIGFTGDFGGVQLISLLGCFPRDDEVSLPQEPSLSPLLPRNEKAHASEFENAPFEEYLHEFEAGTNTAATGRKKKRFSTQRRKEIEDWALEDFETTCKLKSISPHPTLGFFRSGFFYFPRVYRSCDKNLPHKCMVDKAVILTALHGLWRRALVIESEEGERVSDVVHIQLAMVITKGITDLEVDLLSALQKHILGVKGPGKDNMLPIWTCLWLLILTYRETIDAWSSPEHEKKGLPQLARHMYDMLVTLYSGLFRASSPLSLNWLFDDIYKLFGRDRILVGRMGIIKTEFAHFHKFRGHSHTKDALMRKFIFEREMKFLKQPARDPLHTAHYESSKVYYPIRVNTSGDSDPSVSGPRVSFIQSN